jgi:hypothetical protein
MDRTALFHRAAEIRRKIFASLPWGIRLAIVFSEIASDTGYLQLWGKYIGAEFLRSGVVGMPDPGPNFKPAHRNPAATLPNGYMAKFIGSVYGLLLKNYHNPSLAEEAIENYVAKMVAKAKDGGSMIKAVPLASAESYVRHGIILEAKSLARELLKEQARTESLEDTGDEGTSVRRDIADPHALPDEDPIVEPGASGEDLWPMWMKYLEEHQRDMKPSDWAVMVGFLNKHHPRIQAEWMDTLAKKIHPDMPLYFHLRLEGYSSADVVGGGPKNKPTMLKHYEPKSYDPVYWDKTYNRLLIPVSVEFFKKMHETIDDAPPPPV